VIELVAIDPGGHKKKCSAAVFQDARLVAVFERLTIEQAWDTNIVVVERPQQDGRSRVVPPAILMDLAWQAALLVGAFVALGARAVEYTPADWKGGARADGTWMGVIAKASHHANMIESDALAPEEFALIGDAFSGAEVASLVFTARKEAALTRWAPHANGHYSSAAKIARLPDVLDAIGIGLYHLRRIDKDGKRK
jgi:hypothetical protein